MQLAVAVRQIGRPTRIPSVTVNVIPVAFSYACLRHTNTRPDVGRADRRLGGKKFFEKPQGPRTWRPRLVTAALL
jgi:hypothetical protein